MKTWCERVGILKALAQLLNTVLRVANVLHDILARYYKSEYMSKKKTHRQRQFIISITCLRISEKSASA